MPAAPRGGLAPSPAPPLPAPHDRSSVTVRRVTDDDIPEWTRTWGNGYLRPTVEGSAEFMRETLADDRVIGAFASGRCVGTYRSTPQELTVPGGAVLPTSAISKVTVAGTHRRRGLLGRMVRMGMREAIEQGEPVAVLDAAEYPIYGRFGFGPATTMAWFEIDTHRAGLDRRDTDDVAGVEIVDADTYRGTAPGVYDRFRAGQHGAMRRGPVWWQEATGQRLGPGASWTEPFYVLYREPETGEVDGLLSFTAEETWDSMLPRSPLVVRDLIAVTPAAERALVRYAVTLDWISTVFLPYQAPDTMAPLWLGNPRAARITALSDYMWLRVLDVSRALGARTYGVAGSLVLQIDDPAGITTGKWLLEGGPEGAECGRTSRPADIRLTAGALASLYLGDESATRLAVLGQVREMTSGAASVADAMFRAARRPWSPRISMGRRTAGPG